MDRHHPSLKLPMVKNIILLMTYKHIHTSIYIHTLHISSFIFQYDDYIYIYIFLTNNLCQLVIIQQTGVRNTNRYNYNSYTYSQGWIVFIFFLNDRFVMKTTTKKQKTKQSFFNENRFKKRSFSKRSFLKTIVFKNTRF